MMKRIIIASFLLVALLFVSSIAGTIVYYDGIVNGKDSKIESLNNQIENLNSQITNLTAQVSNLTSANLVTGLVVTEVPDNSPLTTMFPTLATFVPSNFWINGSVTNIGHVTAFNAGLHVVAYNADGTLEINMSVPLAIGVYGADATTKAFVVNNPNFVVTPDGGFGSGGPSRIGSLPLGSLGSLQLESLDSGHFANVYLTIFHQGVVTNWTVTPMWTNTP